MKRGTLYTYSNLDELNLLYEKSERQGKDIIPFTFDKTASLLEGKTGWTVDISALVEHLEANTGNRLPATTILLGAICDNRVVVQECLAEKALSQFPFIFSEVEPLYPSQPSTNEPKTVSKRRRTLYTYQGISRLKQIVEYADDRGIPLLSFSQAQVQSSPSIDVFDKSELAPIVDITTVIRAALADNPHILFIIEQLMARLSNTVFIADSGESENILERLPLYFHSKSDIAKIYPALGTDNGNANEDHGLKKVTDFGEPEMQSFIEYISANLIGHAEFKRRLFKATRNFIKLNRIGTKKLLSIFLLGPSGLGKTEAARLLKNFLDPDASLAKINFSNYSRQDALNSLIGSPAGYIGCDGGELGVKVQRSKAAVIVCDEFEKTTRPVINFFLELLEDGVFTDSLAREYDLDGYVLVFTSNLRTRNDFVKIMPHELQSRFDLVCEFRPLSVAEKKTYVDYQVTQYRERLAREFLMQQLTDQALETLTDIDYRSTDNLRDIKRMVEQSIIQLLDAPL